MGNIAVKTEPTNRTVNLELGCGHYVKMPDVEQGQLGHDLDDARNFLANLGHCPNCGARIK